MMNPLTTIKNTTRNLTVAVTLITGLVLTPAIAMADNDGGKRHNRGGEYSSHKTIRHNGHIKKPYRNEAKHHAQKRKLHRDKHGKLGHLIRKQHTHYDRGYRHDHVHVINEYRSHDHGHSHYYDYDPRLSIGLHLGHLDLYFEQ